MREELDAWWAEFETADTRVEVLGSAKLRAATAPVYNAIHSIYGAIDWDAVDFAGSASQAHAEHQDRLADAREALVDAMLADVNAPAGT